MSSKIVNPCETITDVILNYTGSVSFWDAILKVNDLKDWDPELQDQILIPDSLFDQTVLAQLSVYPACNISINDILDQLADVAEILAANTIVNSDSLPPKEPIPIKTYQIKQGESITDVLLNSVGTLAYWDSFLNQNLKSDWAPELMVNEKIKIPSGLLVDENTTRQLNIYPACNASVNNIYAQMALVISIITNLWILKTGYWDDLGIWMDDKNWIDE